MGSEIGGRTTPVCFALVIGLASGCIDLSFSGAGTASPTSERSAAPGPTAAGTPATPAPSPTATGTPATPAPSPAATSPSPQPGPAETPGPLPREQPLPSGTQPVPGTGETPPADPAFGPVVSLDADAYEGVARPLRVTVVDRGASAQGVATLSVAVASVAEPAGETLVVSRSGDAEGTYSGAIGLERVFDAEGAPLGVARSGRIAVYAEGVTPVDRLVVRYSSVVATASYSEPPSTLTGLVTTAGEPRGGALVVLIGSDGASRQTASRPDGSFAFHDVPEGNYHVVAKVNGAVQRTYAATVQQGASRQ